MKIVAPIFGRNNFDGLALPYTFDGSGVTLVRHSKDKFTGSDLFSSINQEHIKSASYAFEYDYSTHKAAEHDISLILLAFNVAHNLNAPFIKFRYCPGNEDHSTILPETVTYNSERLRKQEYFDAPKLKRVDHIFDGIRNMEAVSQRLTNCIYFSCRAMVTQHWIDSYMLLISSMESLVSKNEGRGATKALCERVSKILEKQQVTETMMRDIYGLRSSMVHGRYELMDSNKMNLRHLLELQHIHASIIEEFVINRYYDHFQSETAREEWLNSL